MLVIPFAKIQDIPDVPEELKLIDLNSYNWQGFDSLFRNFWSIELAECFLLTRKTLSQSQLPGLNLTRKNLVLDLLATGVVANVWEDELVGVKKLNKYFTWYDHECSRYSGLSQLLSDYIAQEKRNNKALNLPLRVSSPRLFTQINMWFEEGWLLEKPKRTQVRDLLADKGLILHEGHWVKK